MVPKCLAIKFVTSFLQGPPNYSTYAGLHSNQILTVKVCPSKLTLSLPSLSSGWPVTILTDREAKHSSSNSLLWLSVSEAAELSSAFSNSSCFPSLWTVICTPWVHFESLVSLLLFLFPVFCPKTCLLSLYTLSFSMVFPLLSAIILLVSQMVFPRYNHGFLSGEQSNTFQRRFLKVDQN